MDFTGGLLSGIGGLISNLWTDSRQEDQQKFNAEQAEINRNFQERMSSTAYQRGMADMKEAGLNPILAYQKGGASSPAGASATMIAPKLEGNPLGEAVNTAIALRRNVAEIANMQETNKNIIADTTKKYAETAATMNRQKLDSDYFKQTEAGRLLTSTISNLDHAIYKNSAGATTRQAGTAAEEAARVAAPFVNGAKAIRGLIPSRSTRETNRSDGSSSFEERFTGMYR